MASAKTTPRGKIGAAAPPRTGTRMAALIRGINVGTAKRVAMAELRDGIEVLGYADVHTLLNSGNVVFTSPKDDAAKAAARIEKLLAGPLGVPARVLVLTAAEFAKIVAENRIAVGSRNPARLIVSVLFDPADRAKLTPLVKQNWGRDELALGSRAAYVWCETSQLVSEPQIAVSKALSWRYIRSCLQKSTVFSLRQVATNSESCTMRRCDS